MAGPVAAGQLVGSCIRYGPDPINSPVDRLICDGVYLEKNDLDKMGIPPVVSKLWKYGSLNTKRTA